MNLPESALIRGYSASAFQKRVERCLCGGQIEAEDTSRAIAAAVDLHNRSTLHAHWLSWWAARLGWAA